MQIKNVMSTNPTWLSPTDTAQQAAQKMQELDCGCIPVGENEKLVGIVTDRDIALRAIGQNKNAQTVLKDIMTTKVLYCYETDTVDNVAQNMQQQQVRRLIVLDNQTSKKLVGIVSIGDLVTKAQDNTNSQLIKGVSQTNGKKAKAA